jgi:hypothetical protein
LPPQNIASNHNNKLARPKLLEVFRHGLLRVVYGRDPATFFRSSNGDTICASDSVQIVSQTIYKEESQLQNVIEDVHHD